MSLAAFFERLDRRWIYAVMGLLVLLPLLWPLNLPLEPSPPVRAGRCRAPNSRHRSNTTEARTTTIAPRPGLA